LRIPDKNKAVKMSPISKYMFLLWTIIPINLSIPTAEIKTTIGNKVNQKRGITKGQIKIGGIRPITRKKIQFLTVVEGRNFRKPMIINGNWYKKADINANTCLISVGDNLISSVE
jgi:hypothetical protein